MSADNKAIREKVRRTRELNEQAKHDIDVLLAERMRDGATGRVVLEMLWKEGGLVRVIVTAGRQYEDVSQVPNGREETD